MSSHAFLSASGSKIWLNCTPSARAQEPYPDTETVFSREGTFGHELAGARLLEYVPGQGTQASIKACTAVMKTPEAKEFWTPELSDAVEDYVQRCAALIAAVLKEHKDARVLLEQRLDFSDWVPAGFGTGDLVTVTPQILYVRDLKLGRGVFVDAVDNSQMKLYAAGALATYGMLYPFEMIDVGIDQPRLDNIDGERFTRAELTTWLEEYVRPRAAAAWNGEGEFVAGDHCTFCRARHDCKTRAEYNLAAVADHDPTADFTIMAPTMSEARIAEILPRLDDFIRWAKDLKTWALREQVLGNKKWPGLKLVQGRSVRKIVNEDALADALKAEGIDPALIYDRRLRGLTELERTIGKKKFAALTAAQVDPLTGTEIGALVEKPPGKPKLVPLSDARPEWVPENAADLDFGHLEDE